MPIKFRCVYCEQLLGIARRKAGTVVKCPNCAGQLIVPAPEQGLPDEATAAAPELEVAGSRGKSGSKPPAAAEASGTTEGGMLFERSDFDELLRPVQEKKGPTLAGPAAIHQTQKPITISDQYDAPALVAPAPRAPVVVAKPRPPKGLVLTPGRLALLLVFMILGFATCFAAGLLAGRFVWR